jgi:hypothetical protein
VDGKIRDDDGFPRPTGWQLIKNAQDINTFFGKQPYGEWLGEFEDVEDEVEEPKQDYPKLTIKVEGNKTIVKMWNKGKCASQAIAKCHPEDKFDYLTGIKVALDRMFTIGEGDRVKITNPGEIYPNYIKFMDKYCTREELACWRFGVGAYSNNEQVDKEELTKPGTYFKVLHKAGHLKFENTELCVIENAETGYIYLFDIRGLERV